MDPHNTPTFDQTFRNGSSAGTRFSQRPHVGRQHPNSVMDSQSLQIPPPIPQLHQHTMQPPQPAAAPNPAPYRPGISPFVNRRHPTGPGFHEAFDFPETTAQRMQQLGVFEHVRDQTYREWTARLGINRQPREAQQPNANTPELPARNTPPLAQHAQQLLNRMDARREIEEMRRAQMQFNAQYENRGGENGINFEQFINDRIRMRDARRRKRTPDGTSCVSCGDDDSAVLRRMQCPSRHGICHSCIVQVTRLAIKEEGMYPPTCCSEKLRTMYPIDIDAHRDVLDPELYDDFKAKEKQYKVPFRARIYCATPSCSKLLNIVAGFQVGKPTRCPDCKAVTCNMCKTLYPKNTRTPHKCRLSKADRDFLKIAEDRGMKKCPNCGNMVELKDACNHITCRCGGQFCYKCGMPWAGRHGCPEYGNEDIDLAGYGLHNLRRDRLGLVQVREVQAREAAARQARPNPIPVQAPPAVPPAVHPPMAIIQARILNFARTLRNMDPATLEARKRRSGPAALAIINSLAAYNFDEEQIRNAYQREFSRDPFWYGVVPEALENTFEQSPIEQTNFLSPAPQWQARIRELQASPPPTLAPRSTQTQFARNPLFNMNEPMGQGVGMRNQPANPRNLAPRPAAGISNPLGAVNYREPYTPVDFSNLLYGAPVSQRDGPREDMSPVYHQNMAPNQHQNGEARFGQQTHPVPGQNMQVSGYLNPHGIPGLAIPQEDPLDARLSMLMWRDAQRYQAVNPSATANVPRQTFSAVDPTLGGFGFNRPPFIGRGGQ